ncbi:MAG: hypothetical protein WAO98_08185 [Alphaproteobacteria bacterium]
MQQQLVFYIDFLGFADAVNDWSEEKKLKLISLLHNLESLKSEYNLTETKIDNGTQYNIKPSITTFSDHIVISYPIDDLREKMKDSNPVFTALVLAHSMIGALAAQALNLGLLIRGGATIGPLYHTKGVVMGKAMVEAYELESRVADYPRIAVSRKIYSDIKGGHGIVLLKDIDGITHLNYFQRMILAGGGEPGNSFPKKYNEWIENAKKIISENIEKFEKQEDWRRLKKWVWLNSRFEEEYKQLPAFK